jgi:hypothetical protein
VADDAVVKVAAMLEDLRTRFELVIEAISGFGGKFDGLRQEIIAQFTEVGGQMRFLADQIAENRKGIQAVRSELGAEMVRLGEAIGRTRVEFREDLDVARAELRGEIARAAVASDGRAGSEELKRELAETTRVLRRELSEIAEGTTKRLASELKQANKAIGNLSRKFDRFDDRITVETRDQEQRLKKLEKRGRA